MELDERLLEESVEDLYENAPCGYLSALPDGTIVKVNRTFLDWTGFGRDELVLHRRFQDLLTIAGQIFHETHFAPLLRMQGFVNEVAFDLRCKRGEKLSVLLNATQKKNESGRPLVNRITVFNATDRRNYERELLLERKRAESASAAKSSLLHMVGHDIRNPLTAILGFAERLEKVATTPQQLKYARAIRSASGGILHLTNSILNLGKIETGNLALEEVEFDLRQLVGDIVSNFQLEAETKQVAVSAELDEGLPPRLLGDPVKIGQVLTNLLGNAIKFTDQGSVRMSVRVVELFPEAVCMQFRVADTGIGIPSDKVSQIFEEFTQADEAVGRKYGGSGLGLAISRKLLELYGSRITVESKPGRGSTFAFDLRLSRSPPS